MKTSLKSVVLVGLSALCLSMAIQPAGAAVINWGSAQNISAATDVLTTGTLFASANFAGSNTTVNGVTFNAFPITGGGTSATVGNIGVTAVVGSGTGFISATLTTTSAPFSSLPTSYQNLLGPTLRLTTPGNSLNFTISNLVLGGTYAVQYWVNDPRTNSVNANVRVGGAVNLDPNIGDVSGGLGQWVTGTFVADSTFQSFTAAPAAASANVTYANALQVRTIAVPEPSTIAMLIGAVGSFAGWRLRRSRRGVAPASST
jgi:hypothetical protein